MRPQFVLWGFDCYLICGCSVRFILFVLFVFVSANSDV